MKFIILIIFYFQFVYNQVNISKISETFENLIYQYKCENSYSLNYTDFIIKIDHIQPFFNYRLKTYLHRIIQYYQLNFAFIFNMTITQVNDINISITRNITLSKYIEHIYLQVFDSGAVELFNHPYIQKFVMNNQLDIEQYKLFNTLFNLTSAFIDNAFNSIIVDMFNSSLKTIFSTDSRNIFNDFMKRVLNIQTFKTGFQMNYPEQISIRFINFKSLSQDSQFFSTANNIEVITDYYLYGVNYDATFYIGKIYFGPYKFECYNITTQKYQGFCADIFPNIFKKIFLSAEYYGEKMNQLKLVGKESKNIKLIGFNNLSYKYWNNLLNK